MTPDQNEWLQWSQYVLKALEHNEESHIRIEKAIHNLDVKVARLDVRSSLYGLAAGSLPGILYLAYTLIGGVNA